MGSWTDPVLAELRAAHAKALNAWHDVAPDEEGPHDEESLSEEQQEAMRNARDAEHAYVGALMSAGLVPH